MMGRIFFCAVIIFPGFAFAAPLIEVFDDSGTKVTLDRPAKKIVSLSPHVTELLFSAGAGKNIIATDSGSNYPPAVLNIKKIGGAGQLDYESILALKPDLVVGWLTGNRKESIARLSNLGLKIYLSEPQKLEHIASNLKRLGQLAGTNKIANNSAKTFQAKLSRLEKINKGKKSVKVFYILWHKPMLTINQSHIISDVINLCGGENVFGELSVYTPTVDLESVMLANPDVIITADKGDKIPGWLEAWKKWQGISAVRNNHLYRINPDWIHRQTPRMLKAAEEICSNLDKARK